MQLPKYFAIILFGFVINHQCVPISQSSSESSNNPERNQGFHQGDMVLPPFDTTNRGKGVAIRGASNQWAGGVIPYEFSSNITASNIAFIVAQMRAMENLTSVNNTQCIAFRPKNASDPYYITIFNGSGCYAPVGSWGNYVGIRPVSLMDSPSTTCMVTGIVQHELTHVLGFYHEQSRPDRDSYVSIQWANIDPANAYNFDKYNDTEVDTQMTSYDYGSVMHYEWNAFAINSSGATIIPTQNASAFIGQRIRLSPVDILEIQRYYNCVATPNNATTTTRTTATTTTITTTTTTSTGTTSTSTSSTTSRTTTSTTTSKTTSTSTSMTTSKTTTTSATTTSITTQTTTSATTRTTTSATTSTVTTATTTKSAGVRNVFQSQLGMYAIWLLPIIHFLNTIH